MTKNSNNMDETLSGGEPPPLANNREPQDRYPAIGTKLPPHYEIKAEIGRGGYGRVYEVLNTHEGRKEALKVMWCDPKNPDHRKRCESEIKLLINMPPIEGIVRVYRSDFHENWVYYAMELILDKEGNEGKNIVDYARDNSLLFNDRLGLLVKLCETVEELHQQKAGRLIHRDIKPSNVLIRDYKDPVPMLMDYGISRKLESEETRGFTTRGGPGSSHPGSPLYMAPEQMDVSNQLTPAVDVYALANLVFMVLSDGVHPLQVEEETHFTRQKWVERIHLQQQPRSLCDLVPDVSAELEVLLMQALSYTPDKRPTAKKFGDGLREALQAIPRFRIFISAAAEMGEERALAEAYLERVKTNIQRQVIIDYTISPPSEDIPSRLETFDLVLVLLWSRLESNQPQLFKTLKSLFDSENFPKKARPKVIVFRKTANFTNGLEDDQKVKERHKEHQEMLTFLQETKTKGEKGCFIDHIFDFTAANVFPDLLKGEELWSSLQACINNLRITDQARPHLSTESPFRGLSVFEREHADIFFGRDREISEVIELFRIQQRKELPFVIVYGASGVGKSSFAQAGVLARMIKPHLVPEVQQWRYAIIRPGEHGTPIRSLAQGLMTQALPELRESLSLDTLSADLKQEHKWPKILTQFNQHLHDGNLFLIIDQMEDIFALNTDEKAGETVMRPLDFLRLLVHLCRSQIIWILATVRNDHYPQVTEALARANVKPDAGKYDLLTPNTTALRAIIEQPAQLAGLTWGKDNDTGETINDVLLKATAHRPDSLPLLEFTLNELYKFRNQNSNEITADAYHQLGGIEGAIGNRAEAAFTGLRLKQPERVLGKVFRRLIRFDTDGKPLRDYATYGEMGSDRSCKLLVGTFIENRLLTKSVAEGSKDGHITVVHEALFSHWPQLKTWIDSHKTRLQVYQRIKNEARAWEQSKRDPSLLIPPGRRLEEALELLGFDWDFGEEKVFVLRSKEHADLEQRNKEKLQNVSERRGRLIKYALAALAAVFFVSAVWIYKNYTQIKQQKQKTEKNLQLAVENEENEKKARADAQENAQKADEQRQRVNHELGRLFLMKAEKLIEEKRFEEAYLTAAHAIGYEGMSKPPGFDPKANPRLFEGSREQAIARGILFKFKIRTSWISPYRGQNVGPAGFIFSPNGRYLASYGRTLRLWDIKTGKSIREFKGHWRGVLGVSFSSDGGYLTSVGLDATVRKWDVKTGEAMCVFRGHARMNGSVIFGPDGKYLASAGPDATVRLWDVKTGEAMREFKGHTDQVSCVSFSSDGRYLASGSLDKTIRLWDIKTGEALRVFKGHMAQVLSVSVSLDGMHLASRSLDRTVRLWDVKTGEAIHEFKGSKSIFSSLVFSPEGRYLAFEGPDAIVRLWDVKTAEFMRKFKGDMRGVTNLSFSPDGKYLASVSADGALQLWDVKTGEAIGQFQGHTFFVESVVFSPDDKYVASASVDQTIHLWDVKTGKFMREFKGHTGNVEGVVFSPDGKVLASASWDRTIRLWDVKTGEAIRVFKGHVGFVLSVSFSPDGKYMASSSGDYTIRLWDVKTGESVRVFRGNEDPVLSVSFSSDGKYLASANEDGNISLWNINAGESKAIHKFEGRRNAATSVSFSPDGKHLTSGSSYGTIQAWDVKTGEAIRVFKGHTGSVESVVFNPDGKFLASASGDKSIRLWDVETGESLRVFNDHAQAVLSASFSSDGKYLASASVDRTVRLRDVKSGDSIRVFKGHEDEKLWDISLSSDGRFLASLSSDTIIATIRLWDVKTGEPLGVFKGSEGERLSVSLSPDGKFLASLSSYGIIRIWDVETGEALGVIKGSEGERFSISFTPDCKYLASAGLDAIVRLWEIKTLELMWEFKGHTDSVSNIAFSPDGKTLAFSSLDNTIRLWNINARIELAVLRGHLAPVISLNYSPNGKSLVSVGNDKTVRLWDVEDRKETATLMGDDRPRPGVVFSPDGKSIAIRFDDRTIHLWDVEDRKKIAILASHNSEVLSLVFSPDENALTSFDYNGNMRVWKPSEIPSRYFDYFEFDGLDVKYKLPEPNLYGNKGFHINDPD